MYPQSRILERFTPDFVLKSSGKSTAGLAPASVVGLSKDRQLLNTVLPSKQHPCGSTGCVGVQRVIERASRPKSNQAKCAKALFASAIRCVSSRFVIALPSFFAAPYNSSARRRHIGRPFSLRHAPMIHRNAIDC